MDPLYLGIVAFLFLLAIFDLVVGVSNDAVNFLSSAVGSKSASFRVILLVASVGIFLGASTSNGMMDIARHGIFQPENFFFNELMCIFLAMMVTDVVLLDLFNTMGLPTSTTVSMCFELLGGSFALSTVKILRDNTLSYATLLNTDKALTIIMGIFLSVAIAFVFGMVVQYLARLLFTFNYKAHMKYTVALFGGIAGAGIVYFILVSALKGASFMTAEYKAWIDSHSMAILVACFVVMAIVMQVLHWLKVDIFRVIVLMGTFSLAMAFAGNDLVNFIGVPLAGFESFRYYTDSGATDPAAFTMEALRGPSTTSVWFLVGAGAVMVYALVTSKKAHNVIKTSVDLGRQGGGDEMFGSSSIARKLVRKVNSLFESVGQVVPQPVKQWSNSRFNKSEMILEDGAAFDKVRAAVNLVMAAILISFGTSMKLPLSTTYVTFLVAMGSSLADRAWGRESAVYRITGVLSVVGGWFLTAGTAFTACFFVTLIMFYGGTVAMAGAVILVIFILINSNMRYKRKQVERQKQAGFYEVLQTGTPDQVWTMLSKDFADQQLEWCRFFSEQYNRVCEAFVIEDLKKLRKSSEAIQDMKVTLKKSRGKELLAMRHLEPMQAISKNTWFHLAMNSREQMLYSLQRLTAPCLEHVDNNFPPLDGVRKKELFSICGKVSLILLEVQTMIETGKYEKGENLRAEAERVKQEISRLRQAQQLSIQTGECDMQLGVVYLNLLQETQEAIGQLRHLIRANYKFQG